MQDRKNMYNSYKNNNTNLTKRIVFYKRVGVLSFFIKKDVFIGFYSNIVNFITKSTHTDNALLIITLLSTPLYCESLH